jgi:hypothetical protein
MDGAPVRLWLFEEEDKKQDKGNGGSNGKGNGKGKGKDNGNGNGKGGAYWMVRLMVAVWMMEPPVAVTLTA